MTQVTQGKFQFPEPIAVHLLNVNTRKEIHGEEHVQAVDLSFKADFPSTALNELFAPGLREALYFNPAVDAGQADIEGVDVPLPYRRFAKMNGQKFTWGGKDKLVGYVLRMEFGLGDDVSNIELELCKVSGRVFELKEGGTVTIYWKVSNASERLDIETLGKLALLGGEEVTMSLTAPTVAQEEKVEEPESPFANDNPAPLGDGEDEGLFAEGSPEAALAAAGGAQAWPLPKATAENV